MLAELWSPQINLSIYFILLFPHVFLNSIPRVVNSPCVLQICVHVTTWRLIQETQWKGLQRKSRFTTLRVESILSFTIVLTILVLPPAYWTANPVSDSNEVQGYMPPQQAD